MTDASEWYSDAALAKQARITARGPDEPIDLDDFCGALEPRVQPTAEERCAYCESDARDYVGGELIEGLRWCAHCIDRERHLP